MRLTKADLEANIVPASLDGRRIISETSHLQFFVPLESVESWIMGSPYHVQSQNQYETLLNYVQNYGG